MNDRFSERAIFRARHSNFISRFSRTKAGILCCPFYELKWANGCPFDCSYCYLRGTAVRLGQTWIGPQGRPTVYTNVDDIYSEVDAWIFKHKNDPSLVLHTGELSDSLALPKSIEILSPIIEKFARQSKHKLLLLTKSKNVDGLLPLQHKGQTVVGFSVNPPSIVEEYEHDTAGTEERLRAAKKCIAAGYPVMLRVDPMIPVSGWREIYRCFLAEINALPVLGIAIGTLRAFGNLYRLLPSHLQRLLTKQDFDRRFRIQDRLRYEMYSLAMSIVEHPRVGICKEGGAWSSGLYAKFKKRFFCNCRLE